MLIPFWIFIAARKKGKILGKPKGIGKSYDIRRLIYTTNAVEGYHRQVRKVTKTKGSFNNDMSLLKLVWDIPG